MIQIMFLYSHWVIVICLFALSILSIVNFVRRVSAFRRVVRRVGRGFRRVNRKVGRAFRRVQRVQRKFAKTDPKIYNSIKTASSNTMKEVLDSKATNRVKAKDIKKEVKNQVAIKIEKELQESPMRDMRPLIDKTIDETINLALFEEVSKRGDQLNITRVPPINKFLWRLILPLCVAGGVGGLSFFYPDKIPPGDLVIPEIIHQPGVPPPPIDPIQVVQSILINAAVYGLGALILVGLLILIRRK